MAVGEAKRILGCQ